MKTRTFETSPGLNDIAISRFAGSRSKPPRYAVADGSMLISSGTTPQHKVFADNVQAAMEQRGYETVHEGGFTSFRRKGGLRER